MKYIESVVVVAVCLLAILGVVSMMDMVGEMILSSAPDERPKVVTINQAALDAMVERADRLTDKLDRLTVQFEERGYVIQWMPGDLLLIGEGPYCDGDWMVTP